MMKKKNSVLVTNALFKPMPHSWIPSHSVIHALQKHISLVHLFCFSMSLL